MNNNRSLIPVISGMILISMVFAAAAAEAGGLMQAIVYTEYGSADVLQLKDVEKPVPKDDEVLVKVYATSVNAADWHIMRGSPVLIRLAMGFLKPQRQVLGFDIAGKVEAVGRNVNEFQPDDLVFGASNFGGFAEYITVTEHNLVLIPPNLSFAQAAAVPTAAYTALQGLRDKGKIKVGQKVLINGASGGVGTFAVQLARYFGGEITAVCSTRNLDMARSLGADHVIDYTREDFTENGQHYDLIMAANGYHWIYDYRRALSPTGTYVATGGSGFQSLQAMFLGPLTTMLTDRTMTFLVARPNKEDLVFLRELLETGKIVPVIDKQYNSLSEVPDAVRYIEQGHARGKVVIKIAQD